MGIVIIGRDEGHRLQRCLSAVRAADVPAVYVDSGSTDQSVDLANTMLDHVVELDDSQPFTAARGRNAGMRLLVSIYPDLSYVQFVDGDCELDATWLSVAQRELLAHRMLGLVCGTLRERDASASIYKRLCDIEWSGPYGDIKSCGGIFMARIAAMTSVGGFDPSIAAGEEPELCSRLRGRGWGIRRISAPMAEHDADIANFGQWWTRAVRSGDGAMCALLRSSGHMQHEPRDLRRVLSVLLWSILLPLVALAAAWPTAGVSLLLLLAYPIQWWRVRSKLRRRGISSADATLGSTFTLLGKFAEAIGVLGAIKQRRAAHAHAHHTTPPAATVVNSRSALHAQEK